MKRIIFIIVLLYVSADGVCQYKQNPVIGDTLLSELSEAITVTPFSNIGNNVLHSFDYTGILLQFAGIASTYALSSQNVDYHVSTYFQNHTTFSSFALPAVILDASLPLTTGAFLYFYGKHISDKKMIGASFAVLQAGLITLSYITILKGITGREHPDPNSPEDRKQISKSFRFGLVRGGVYRGWPSGHVGAAMSVASTLTNYYPDKTWLKIVAYGWVGYSMVSVSAFNKGTMHWFSDAIAAGFMTYSIGKTVGIFYRHSLIDTEDVKFRLLPVMNADYTGICLICSL